MRNKFLGTHARVYKDAFKRGKLLFLVINLLTLVTFANIYLFIKLAEEITNVAYLLVSTDESFLANIDRILIYISLIIIVQFVALVKNILKVKLDYRLEKQYNYNVAVKLSEIDYEYFESHEYSMVIEKAKSSYPAYNKLLYNFTSYIQLLFSFIVYWLVIKDLGIYFSIAIVLVLVVAFYLSIQLGNVFYRSWNKLVVDEKKEKYLFRVLSSKEAHHENQVNKLYPYLSEKWKDNYDAKEKQYRKNNIFGVYISSITGLLFIVVFFILLIKVINEIKLGYAEIGMLSAILVIAKNVYTTSETMSWEIKDTTENIAKINDYFSLLNYSVATKDSIKLPTNFTIVLNDVTYRYPQQKKGYALSGADLEIKQGETIALIGENGSGKTTFISILCGLLKGYNGNISISGNQLSKDKAINMNDIAAIFQDFCKYQMTVKENIVQGLDSNYTDNEILDILDKVNLKDDIMKLEKGIHTDLGQLSDGVELSKGQWQKIAIAKLIANKTAKIWILDEPTAYLDPIAEVEIYKIINSLGKGKTIIFISHRLGFARNCDKIIVFKDGKVCETGTHKNLIQNESYYKEMYDIQKSWYM